jgi:hypothetical protein
MGEKENHATSRFEHAGGRLEDRLEWVHVLQAEEKDGGVERCRTQFRDSFQTSGISDQEVSVLAVPLASQRSQTRAGVHADVRGPGTRNVWRQHALTRPNVEYLLSRFRVEQFHDGGYGDFLVMLATALADPAVVPVSQRVPAGRCGGGGLRLRTSRRSSPSFATRAISWRPILVCHGAPPAHYR